MKKFFNAIVQKVRSVKNRVANFISAFMNTIATVACGGRAGFACECRGDLATNTIGGIIVAVVIIGILVIAINNFFPSFFAEMFESMKNKLNANW